MRVALHNIHHLPINLQFHDYIFELLRKRLVTVLYFSDRSGISYAKSLLSLVRHKNKRKNIRGIDWREFEFVFTAVELNRKADVLLNLNLMCFSNIESDFSGSVSKFNGLKIFHVGDYFWYRPGSESHRLLQSVGVDHVFGYAMHDRYCNYFQNYFPAYHGKVWGIPFGYSPRFVAEQPFDERMAKAVAVGSVNPLRPLHEPTYNYRESADFFPDECWFHKFRRQLILNKDHLSPVMDSMLPEFPMIKDFKYDIDCNKEYGLVDGQNCIMFKQYDIEDFKEKISWYQANKSHLKEIATEGNRFVMHNYSREGVANKILQTTKLIWDNHGKIVASKLGERLEIIE